MKLELTSKEFLQLYNVLRDYVKSSYGNENYQLIDNIVKSLENYTLKTLKAYEYLTPLSDNELVEWEKSQFEKIELLREQEEQRKKMSATVEALTLEIEIIKQKLSEGTLSSEEVRDLKFNLRACEELLEKTTKVLKEGKQVLKG